MPIAQKRTPSTPNRGASRERLLQAPGSIESLESCPMSSSRRRTTHRRPGWQALCRRSGRLKQKLGDRSAVVAGPLRASSDQSLRSPAARPHGCDRRARQAGAGRCFPGAAGRVRPPARRSIVIKWAQFGFAVPAPRGRAESAKARMRSGSRRAGRTARPSIIGFARAGNSRTRNPPVERGRRPRATSPSDGSAL